MDPFVILRGALALLALLTGIQSLDERKRILKGKCEFLRARIDDIVNIERASFYDRVQRSKKRKRDDDVVVWMTEGREHLAVTENLLTQMEEHRSFLPSVRKRLVIGKVISSLVLHDKKGDMLCRQAFSEEQGPLHGNHIPVRKMMGQGALNTLEELKNLLQDSKVGRVAIHGREGIGKTCLMKHLHNCALNWIEKFAYVFWVTCPDHFSIRLVQDTVAAVVKCDFVAGDDLNLRARILSKKFRDLGNFVLFLDGVPKADFILEQIGIPVPTEGGECKLVLTTSCATLECRMLDGFGRVKLNCLSETEAFELFMHEAGIDLRTVTSLGNTPRLLAEKCHGVPHTIATLASRMCGIDDLHEWKNLLFEIENFENKTKLPSMVIINELGV